MSLEIFDDKCPGCRPALLDLKTNKPLPQDHPHMIKVMKVWSQTTYNERKAFHQVCCQNSRDAVDLFIMGALMKRIEVAISKDEPNE